MENLNHTIQTLIQKKEPFAITTIISHSGSTPRTSGSKMLVLQDGSIKGTIGGGLIEAKVIEEAKELIPLKKSCYKSYHLNKNLKDSIDMVCGGSLTVFIEIITPKNQITDLFEEMFREAQKGRKCLKISELETKGSPTDKIRYCLVKSNREILGDNVVPDDFSGDFLKPYFKKKSPSVTELGSRLLIIEPAFIQGTVYLFGAGHVSRQVAIITDMLDFRTVVIDDRKEFANKERFPAADEIVVTNDFSTSLSPYTMNPDCYIVILTRGHLHDQTVLREALKTPAGYIGMIGSKRKRAQVYQYLMKEGFKKTDFERVKSPIGLEIEAETPAEIAVSITAELIDIKNRR